MLAAPAFAQDKKLEEGASASGTVDATGAAGAAAKTDFVEREVEPAEIDVDISIGTAIPQTVTLHPLPPRVMEIVPEYEGYMYLVLADGRIIIVEPATYEVVYIIVV